jgi:SAM-dependent methyltransferase
MLTARYEDGEYLRRVPDWHAADAPWKAGHILRMLSRHGLRPRTICDVGCGAGAVLLELQKRLAHAPRLHGYDISPDAISLCRPKENGRLSFHHGDFLALGGEVFELLLSLDVLEHVPDYLGFLTSLRTRADRFVFHIPLDVSVQTVTQGSRHMDLMRERYGHLHYFTAETAFAALKDAGYGVDDFFYTWDSELEGWPPRAPGLKGALSYPLLCARYGFERLAFELRPDLTARFRPAYNLLVLARPARKPTLVPNTSRPLEGELAC